MKHNIQNIILILLVLQVLLFSSCNKEKITLPVVSTIEITNQNQNSAQSGGVVVDMGGEMITQKGVCWSTNSNPTIIDSRSFDGSGSMPFTSTIDNLRPNTVYFVKAYAINGAGCGYGEEIFFTTSPIAVPVLSTTEITSIDKISASSGGKIISNGGTPIISKGICWSVSENPVIDDNLSVDGNGDDAFISLMTRLIPSTTYYVRAYATNKVGVGYGEVQIFSTKGLVYGKVTDVEGNEYKTIPIGDLVWMAENLKTTKYADGTPITLVNSTSTWNQLANDQGAYCWYGDNIEQKSVYGALYNWSAAMKGAQSSNTIPSNVQGVCPIGWHLPSYNEWGLIESYIYNFISRQAAAYHLKETGTLHWAAPNDNAINDVGFTALPGGYRTADGIFKDITLSGHWWSSTVTADIPYIYGRGIWNNSSYFGVDMPLRKTGYSVRCLKD